MHNNLRPPLLLTKENDRLTMLMASYYEIYAFDFPLPCTRLIWLAVQQSVCRFSRVSKRDCRATLAGLKSSAEVGVDFRRRYLERDVGLVYSEDQPACYCSLAS